MQQHTLESTIDHLLGAKKDKELRDLLDSIPYTQIALCINHFVHGKAKIFRLLSPEKKRKVLWELHVYSRKYVLLRTSNPDVTQLVDGMDSDDATDILIILPKHRQEQILKMLSEADSKEIVEILNYPENSAGHIMQKELIKVPEYFSVLDTIKRIQRLYKTVQHISFVYVSDNAGIFLGHVPLEKLVVSKPHTKMKELVVKSSVIPVLLDQEEVAHIFKHADLPALPVVDAAGKLVGRITADDIVDVLEEEQSEDMYKMAGIIQDEGVFDPPFLSAKRRLPWLAVNLVTAIFAAFIVSLFQGTIQRIVILAAYMPIVAGMGGNAATQTITVIVRAIALQKVELKQVWGVLAKESFIGVVNGISLGVLVGIISYIYNGNYMLGVVIGLSMVGNLLIAGISGTIIPLALKSLKLDPALASSVFVTTCTDVGGFLTFLGMATVLL